MNDRNNTTGNYRYSVSSFTSRRGNHGKLGYKLQGARIVSLRATIASDTSIRGENDARRRGSRWFRHFLSDHKQSRPENRDIRY